MIFWTACVLLVAGSAVALWNIRDVLRRQRAMIAKLEGEVRQAEETHRVRGDALLDVMLRHAAAELALAHLRRRQARPRHWIRLVARVDRPPTEVVECLDVTLTNPWN